MGRRHVHSSRAHVIGNVGGRAGKKGDFVFGYTCITCFVEGRGDGVEKLVVTLWGKVFGEWGFCFLPLRKNMDTRTGGRWVNV